MPENNKAVYHRVLIKIKTFAQNFGSRVKKKTH